MLLNLIESVFNSQFIKPFMSLVGVVSMTCFKLLKKTNHTDRA